MNAINVAVQVTGISFQMHIGIARPDARTRASPDLDAECAGQKGYLA